MDKNVELLKEAVAELEHVQKVCLDAAGIGVVNCVLLQKIYAHLHSLGEYHD